MTTTVSSSPRRRAILAVAAGVCVAAYVALATFHVAYGSMNVDEGFYAAATRAVWQGEMPYRDFGFTQPPLVPYVNAPALALTGFGLFQQRAVNGAWGALALLLAARLVRRRAGNGAALTLTAIFVLTPAWLYFIHLGKTYGLTSLLAMSMVTAFLELRPGNRKTIVLSALAAAGVACRLPAAPFFGLLWLAALWDGGRPTLRRVAAALAAVGGFTAIAWLPFIIAAPEQTWFWVFDFHRVSVPQRGWRMPGNDVVALAPAIWLVALLAAGFQIFVRQGGRQPEIVVAIVALVALAANLLPGGVYQEYAVPFLPPLVASALILLEPAVSRFSHWHRGLATGALLAVSVALIPIFNSSHLEPVKREFPSTLLPARTPPYDFDLPTAIAAARQAVQQALPPGRPFIGPAILLAVEADRPVPRRFRMGAFACTFDYDEAKADRLHLATLPEFERQLRDADLPIVGLHTENKFNYFWSMPSLALQPPESFAGVQLLLQRDFVVVHTDRNFVVAARRPASPSR